MQNKCTPKSLNGVEGGCVQSVDCIGNAFRSPPDWASYVAALQQRPEGITQETRNQCCAPFPTPQTPRTLEREGSRGRRSDCMLSTSQGNPQAVRILPASEPIKDSGTWITLGCILGLASKDCRSLHHHRHKDCIPSLACSEKALRASAAHSQTER